MSSKIYHSQHLLESSTLYIWCGRVAGRQIYIFKPRPIDGAGHCTLGVAVMASQGEPHLFWLAGQHIPLPSTVRPWRFTHTQAFLAQIVKFLNGLVAGIRAFHADGDPSDAAGGLRDGARLHLRHPQAPAHDHLRRGEGAHTGNNKLYRLFAASKYFPSGIKICLCLLSKLLPLSLEIFSVSWPS